MFIPCGVLSRTILIPVFNSVEPVLPVVTSGDPWEEQGYKSAWYVERILVVKSSGKFEYDEQECALTPEPSETYKQMITENTILDMGPIKLQLHQRHNVLARLARVRAYTAGTGSKDR